MKRYLYLAILLVFITNLSFSKDILPNTPIRKENPKSDDFPRFTPNINGTVRAKYEYNSSLNANRFQVRNARFSINGPLSKKINYKAEIDLSDKGITKMLDAFVQLKPSNDFDFTIGQQRVPFGNDVLRSPHQLIFANRSFIAKQMSLGLRDVGAAISYRNNYYIPIEIRAGLYNGNGILEQEDWNKNLSYVVRAGIKPCSIVNLHLGYLSFKPYDTKIYMYNISSSIKTDNLHLEFEYTLRTYEKRLFDNTHAFSVFFAYNPPKRYVLLSNISPVIRYDLMTNSSDGRIFDKNENIILNENGKLNIDDKMRSRITSGFTIKLDKPYLSDLRINYEHYIYKNKADNKDNKLVVEFVVRF